jgi:hypothetical protein
MKRTVDWRTEMERFVTDENHIRLLREGPHSHHEARLLGALKYRYNKIMGIESPEPKDCQSSFKEWNEQTKSL